MSKTIIGFAAHPDDLEFSCTATLYKFKQKGYRIIYVVVTNGVNGFKVNSHLDADERIEIRTREQLEVARKLGVEEVVFLDYDDGFLTYTEELRSRLVSTIKKYKPEIIFSFDPANRTYDNLNLFHRDHRVVAEAVFDSCFAAKNQFMYPGDGHMVSTIYFFGSHQPNYFEDISDLIEFKLQLLACHQSQFPDFQKITEFIKNKVSKGTDEYEYSEAFRIMQVEQIS